MIRAPAMDLPLRNTRRAVVARWAITVGILSVLIGVLGWQRQRLAGLPAILLDAQWGWVLAAVAAQAVSMTAMAREMRRLLAVGGARLPLPSVLATVYAANAISATMPLVGSAAAAVFAFSRYAALGVERAAVAWAIAVSGVYSTVTLAVLAATGALVSGSRPAAVVGAAALVVGVLPVGVVFTLLHHPAVRRTVTRLATGGLARLRFVRRRRSVSGWIGPALDRMAELRLGPRSMLLAAAAATSNWLANLGCLCAALAAVGAHIPWQAIVLVWAAGTGVSSLGLTPGGLGVVEATLAGGLIAAGVPAAPAVAAVVVYRAVSLWLVVVTGAMVLAVVRSRIPTTVDAPSVTAHHEVRTIGPVRTRASAASLTCSHPSAADAVPGGHTHRGRVTGRTITRSTPMTTVATTLRRPQSQTPYEYRLSLVVGVLSDQTDLDAAAVQETAVQVLRSIDTIPEHIR